MAVLASLGELGLLGAGLEGHAGRMQPENIGRSLAHVRAFLETARGLAPGRTVLVGTEVFRRAANVDDFRAGLPDALPLRVLTPDEEAAGSCVAACWGCRQQAATGAHLILIDLAAGTLQVAAGVHG